MELIKNWFWAVAIPILLLTTIVLAQLRLTVGEAFAVLVPLLLVVAILGERFSRGEKPAKIEGSKPRPHTDAERHRVAVHEAGHLVVGGAVGLAAVIKSATIVPDGRCRGHVARHDEGTEPNLTRREYRNSIAYHLGGRVAEELLYPTDGADSGSTGDLRQADEYASHMLSVAGLGEGKLAYLNMVGTDAISEELLVMLETAKRTEIQAQAARAKTILEANRALLDDIAAKLVEVGKLEGAELTLLLCKIQIPS